eukprot:192308-Hanusia_phi.AAC.2
MILLDAISSLLVGPLANLPQHRFVHSEERVEGREVDGHVARAPSPEVRISWRAEEDDLPSKRIAGNERHQVVEEKLLSLPRQVEAV